ncbi:MAG: S1C family serine protease [Candidatus Uhrbacteria bacterium]
MKYSNSHAIKTTFLALLLGLGGGTISAALTTNYLNDYAVSLGQTSTPPRLSEERPRTTPVTYADAVRAVTESVLPGVAQIYAVGSFAKPIASGAVLTSDGWMVTLVDRLPSMSGLSVVVGGHVHSIVKEVADPSTGATFLKLDATNLPVFAFGSGFDLLPGDQLFAAASPSALFSESLVESKLPAGPLSTDALARRLAVADPLIGSFPGTPVVNARGELVGLVEGGAFGFSTILPTDGLLVAFNGLLREGIIANPSLGVLATDLSRTIGLSEKDTGGLSQGALLLGPSSIKKGGAAAVAGLLAGDVILSADGTAIDAHRSLDELVATHAVGDTLTLRVSRAGKETEVKATLGAM